MSTVYAATSIEKRVSDWHPTEGASTNSWITLDKRINLQAETLQELLKKIEETYFIEMGYVFIHGEDDESVEWISANQVEDNDGNEPSEADTAEWEAGRLKLYLCDYDFWIEKRVIEPISRNEFKLANIQID